MKHLLFLSLLFAVTFVNAQDLPCWTQPVPPEEIPRKFMREAQDDEQWTIGVIITVIGDQADQQLMSDAFLAEEMRFMNDAYAGRLSVTPPFLPVDTRIQFRLHRTRRVLNSGADFTNADPLAMYDPAKGGAAIDSPLYYVNLYYCNISFAGGFSVFPRSNTIGSSIDGNVIRIQSVLNHRLVNPHEVGHWFNLYHTFQPPQKGCGTHTTGNGDEIDDTPPIFGSTSGCPYGRLACFVIAGNPVNSQGQPIANVANIMDYANCEENFTEGQKDRMRAAILFYRPQLLSNVPPPPAKYNCTNFTCVQSPTGAYASLSACQLACASVPSGRFLNNDTTIELGATIQLRLAASANATKAEWFLNGSSVTTIPGYYPVYWLMWTPNANGIYKTYFKVFSNSLFAWSDTLTVTVGNVTVRYNCTNNTCVASTTGQYATLSQCQSSCIAPPSKYSCTNNQCVISTNGFNSLAECQAACGVENKVHTITILSDGRIKFIGCNGEIIKP